MRSELARSNSQARGRALITISNCQLITAKQFSGGDVHPRRLDLARFYSKFVLWAKESKRRVLWIPRAMREWRGSRARHEPSRRQREPWLSARAPLNSHRFLALSDGCRKLDYQLQAAPNRKLFRRQEQSPHAILRRAVAA